MKKMHLAANPMSLVILAGMILTLPLCGCDRISAPDSTGAGLTATEETTVDDTVKELSADYEQTAVELTGTPTCNILWSSAYGGDAADSARSIVSTADGGLALAGYTKSSGAGSNDFLAIKLDAAGAVQWSKTFGSFDNELAYSIAATDDGGVIMAGEKRIYSILDEFNLTPSYRYDFWVVKLDSEGNRTWSETYGGDDYDAAKSIISCAGGGYVMAGYTQSYGAEYDPGPHAKKDLWVIKIDSEGNRVWETLFGSENKSDCAESIRECADGGYILCGFSGAAGDSGYDCLLVRLNGDGDVLWSRTTGGARSDKAMDVIETADGSFISVGETMSFGAGNSDYYVLCHSSNGALQWSKTFGGTSFERARSIAAAPDGSCIIAGYTSSSGAGSRDFWLVTINSSGEKITEQTLGGESCDEAFSITATTDGNFAVAGNTSSYGLGELDCWVVKFGIAK
ncbi:MAG TPA: hypothetical protein PK926_08665 [Spirochaetota bacterium]|nr:hypothetical protein [Spirochaetota bacterium]HPI90099.1 hypothetical protein [Spirochaetota bacterium]HPR49539.1 hypothetical protein [Spirochaetota bacterium]